MRDEDSRKIKLEILQRTARLVNSGAPDFRSPEVCELWLNNIDKLPTSPHRFGEVCRIIQLKGQFPSLRDFILMLHDCDPDNKKALESLTKRLKLITDLDVNDPSRSSPGIYLGWLGKKAIEEVFGSWANYLSLFDRYKDRELVGPFGPFEGLLDLAKFDQLKKVAAAFNEDMRINLDTFGVASIAAKGSKGWGD